MCMQCMATAMTAGAATTGMRAWLATRSPSWMTPQRLKRGTAAILAAGRSRRRLSHGAERRPAVAKAASVPVGDIA